ncbi:MAG: ABC transporter ATP-binding protein, partial [Eggerthella sp.]|nr:ABC transporter ATP-binding protein [Eggerthella sp.]
MTEQTAQEKPNQGFLASYSFDDANLETMIEVDHVSMIFNMASEQLHSLKEYAISLARRELSFKEFRALNDISLTVKRGDVFGIMGTNGSGKSTLLKIIAGVLDPSEGTCSINGSIAPLIELGAGFDLELTARENIYLNGALLGYSKEFINEHFDEIVNFAEIRPFLDMPMKNYSSGMVARVAFAIATVIVPDILIVDEVLSVGDFMFQQKCERRIQSLIRDYGVTVLIVSHNSDQIERLCNKAIWIEKGHTRMIGPADEVCDIYRSIGGRVGSKEAEARVYDLMMSPLEPREE